MCANCHENGEQAIALVHQMLERHPNLKVDIRFTSDETFVDLAIHRIDRASQEVTP